MTVYKTLIRPVLTYGSDTWLLTTKILKFWTLSEGRYSVQSLTVKYEVGEEGITRKYRKFICREPNEISKTEMVGTRGTDE